MKNCVFCGVSIQRHLSIGFIFSLRRVEDSHICEECMQKFERLSEQSTCPGCSRKQIEKTMCEDCRKWMNAYKKIPPNHRALYSYNEIAREYMSRFKFHGDVILGKVFKDILAQELKQWSKTHTIVPIPLSPQARKTRGFNQVEILLREANIPFQNCLTNTRSSEKQSSKTRIERLQAKQPFELLEKGIHLNEKPILIVDDVYTTGRTIYHAREMLETIGNTTSFSLFR